MQGVGSMVMGLKPVELLDAPMVPVDAQTGGTWPYPPVLLMQAQNDQPDVVDTIKRTISVFSRQACAQKPSTGSNYASKFAASDVMKHQRSGCLMAAAAVLAVLQCNTSPAPNTHSPAGHPRAQAGHAALPHHAGLLRGAHSRRQPGGVHALARPLARSGAARRARLQQCHQRHGAGVRAQTSRCFSRPRPAVMPLTATAPWLQRGSPSTNGCWRALVQASYPN